MREDLEDYTAFRKELGDHDGVGDNGVRNGDCD